jgi:hypothetical protein
MRGVALELFEVESRSYLPTELEVGAFYLVQDERVIIVNHGDGKVVAYGGPTGFVNATNDLLGLVKGNVAVDGGATIAEDGSVITPLAQPYRSGTLRVQNVSADSYNGYWTVDRDKDGKAFVTGRREGEAEALAASASPSIANPFMTREDNQAQDTAHTAMLTEEREARRVAEANINLRIDSVIGKLRYMPANDFGTDNPTFEELSAWAMQHTGLTYVENATSITNTFGDENTEWIYSDADGGEWVKQGKSTIATASNTNLGVVQGDAETEGGVQVRVDGRMTVPVAKVDKAGLVRPASSAGVIETASPVDGYAPVGITSEGLDTASRNQLYTVLSARGTAPYNGTTNKLLTETDYNELKALLPVWNASPVVK